MIENWVIKKVLRAFENKDVSTVTSLVLHHNINPNTLIASKGVSLLHLIIGHQSESFAFRITKLFLRCGGDPNVQSTDGVTPIHVAAAWGRNRILHLLLVNGGDPWIQDDEKKNAFNYAFEEQEWNTIEMLHHFQQMHSAANCKQELDGIPKFNLNLERVLLRKGEEMFAYTPTKKTTKSITTQTQSDLSDGPSSPVQDKIKYFEPNPIPAINVSSRKKPEKTYPMGWTKDFYQTSCEVMVHCNPVKESESRKKEEEEEKKGKETFISSIHIDTSLNTDLVAEKPLENPSLSDVRGQLFVELQEAVRRRSKLKMVTEKSEADSKSEKPSLNSSSVVVVNNGSIEHDPFVTKEVSYLYGINLEEDGMLKNMSNFATKVMNEIEVTEDDSCGQKAINLCISSPELTNTYLSCDSEPSHRKSDFKNIQTISIPQSSSDNSNLYLTPYASNFSSDLINDKFQEENSNESFVSMSEEYKYTDAEENVVLLEKKLLVTPTISMDLADEDDIGCSKSSNETSSNSSTGASIPSNISYNSDVLRCELKGLGCNPGPITKTTKKLYLKKLWRLKRSTRELQTDHKENLSPVYSPNLEKTLTRPRYYEAIPTFQHLEEEMCQSFVNWTKRKWREGNNKTSFNYLLLDPRVSLNLPKRASTMEKFETWKCFLAAIFYVGKGKRSRPYAHLYQAATFWEKGIANHPDEKTQMIMEIWKEGLGVICLQVFQNVIPVEALTREAAIIEALGLSNLKNSKKGDYYGVASTWRKKEKIALGTYLLNKAMQIFLNEGERQIRPYDID